jgi:hypothetical protein
MASIKKFNWVQRPTTWGYVQAWNAQRKYMASQFLDDASTLSSSFVDAQNSQLTGMANLAAQAAIDNAKKKLEATKSQLSSIGSSLNLTA